MTKKASNKEDFVPFVKLHENVIIGILEKTDHLCLATYVVILKHRNTKTNKCFPSILTISGILKVSDSTVKRAIKKLEDNDFLIINSGTRGVSNNYYFPQEPFFKEWEDDYDQMFANRKKNPFRKAKTKAKANINDASNDTENYEDYEDAISF